MSVSEPQIRRPLLANHIVEAITKELSANAIERQMEDLDGRIRLSFLHGCQMVFHVWGSVIKNYGSGVFWFRPYVGWVSDIP
jgi:hypothetical protein